MKSLRHRTGAAPAAPKGLQTAFVQAEKRLLNSTWKAK
jgi:hypothetical protein